MFVNTYDDTIQFLLTDGEIDIVIICLLSFAGILTIFLPLWTHQLLVNEKVINNNVSNDRTLSAMSASGDILGIIEFVEFASLSNVAARLYVTKTIETINFKDNIFPFMPLLQQYQLMKYLYQEYGLQLSSEFQNRLIVDVITDPKKRKRFKYKFKDDDQSLEAFINDCIDVDNIFRSLPSLYCQHMFVPIRNLLIKYVETRGTQWNKWSLPVDLSDCDWQNIMLSIKTFTVDMENEFPDKDIEKNFYIHWNKLLPVEQVQIVGYCFEIAKLKLSDTKQHSLMSGWNKGDVAANDPKLQPFIDSLTPEFLPLLFLRLFFDYFLDFTQQESQNGFQNWDPPMDISYFSHSMMQQLIAVIDSGLENIDNSKKLFEWICSTSFDNSSAKNKLLKQFKEGRFTSVVNYKVSLSIL